VARAARRAGSIESPEAEGALATWPERPAEREALLGSDVGGTPAILEAFKGEAGITVFEGVRMPLDLATTEEAVLEAIEAIRPALQSDGGDIVYRGLDEDGVVHVELVGACGSCPVSMMTLKAGVERIIMDRAPGVTEVVADE
jgi:Fe-S cluster biogenesis protein NfuA